MCRSDGAALVMYVNERNHESRTTRLCFLIVPLRFRLSCFACPLRQRAGRGAQQFNIYKCAQEGWGWCSWQVTWCGLYVVCHDFRLFVAYRLKLNKSLKRTDPQDTVPFQPHLQAAHQGSTLEQVIFIVIAGLVLQTVWESRRSDHCDVNLMQRKTSWLLADWALTSPDNVGAGQTETAELHCRGCSFQNECWRQSRKIFRFIKLCMHVSVHVLPTCTLLYTHNHPALYYIVLSFRRSCWWRQADGGTA